MRKFQLGIPEPCHEDWRNMSVTQEGRFCQSCNKEVIDFTGMTDEQIFKKIGNSLNICGRIEDDMLGRNLLERKKNNFLHVNVWKLLLPAFLFSKGVTAQGKLAKVKVCENKKTVIGMKSAPPIEMMGFMVPSYEKKFVLHGFVTDSISNEPIAATIILNSINLFVDNGSGFKISGKTMSSIITVEVSAKGFEKKKISLSIPVDWF